MAPSVAAQHKVPSASVGGSVRRAATKRLRTRPAPSRRGVSTVVAPSSAHDLERDGQPASRLRRWWGLITLLSGFAVMHQALNLMRAKNEFLSLAGEQRDQGGGKPWRPAAERYSGIGGRAGAGELHWNLRRAPDTAATEAALLEAVTTGNKDQRSPDIGALLARGERKAVVTPGAAGIDNEGNAGHNGGTERVGLVRVGQVEGADAAIGDAPETGAASVLLGIPTVPRPRGMNYLDQTLHAVLSQVDKGSGDDSFVLLKILVLNVHGDGHSAFDEARRKYGDRTDVSFMVAGDAFDARDEKVTAGEGNALPPRAMAKKKTLPAHKVMKQTRDLVVLLRAAGGRADNYLFMEDDMLLCEGGVAAISRMISKAHSYYPDWIAIRASFGMNGIVLQDKDVLPFADFLEDHQKRRPPDHLVVEWFAGETGDTLAYKAGRRHLAFRYNIFEHLGEVSTLRGKPSPSYPTCFEELTTKTLFEVEAFDAKRCPADDVSPCNVPDEIKAGYPRVDWQGLYGTPKALSQKRVQARL